MDSSAGDITFDANGVCSYCTDFEKRVAGVLGKPPSERRSSLSAMLETIKTSGKNRRYDCVVGVSGGVDSSYTLVKAVEMGLRPLAVHMDNGWNSELAQSNIANLIRGLGVDLYTHVINWEEYRRLMQAFFDANVVDIELLYDNAMIAVNYRQASRFGVKYILAGTNQATEGIRMPAGWNWLKHDKLNIRAIAMRHVRYMRFDTFPAIGTIGYVWYEIVRRLRWTSLLDYLEYNKKFAEQELKRDFGFKPYPYKHYESVFTRFYQGYILPKKFGIDKRRVHFSTLIMTGQMTRAVAIEKLEKDPYPSILSLERDIKYVLKKMKWKRADLEDYIRRPIRSHSEYLNEWGFWRLSARIYKAMTGKGTRLERAQ